MSLYKFKSKAGGDVIMLAAHGDAMLQAMGRQSAPKGIIEVADLAHAIASLRALDGAETRSVVTAGVNEGSEPGLPPSSNAQHDASPKAVSLRQRAHPLLGLLTASAAAGVPVVWGV